MPTLADLVCGQHAEVLAISGPPAFVQRIYELGLLEGERLELIAVAPLGDPIEIRLGNSRLSLRRSEAAHIDVRIIHAP
ncbi:MAG: FeoA family protein [Gemmataceae bacterium]|nr:ferrous iron transport protein A [Gemmata sp.]MDW8198933.1 FeoA family protein [Gemmataceae bacterium]